MQESQSTVHEIAGSWRKASGPFWHLESAACDTLQLLDRGGGRCAVVAVFNPAKKDYRLKVWLDPAQERSAHWFEGRLGGYAFTLHHAGNGFHQSRVDSRSLYRCLRHVPLDLGADIVDEEDRDDPGYLDVCIQTQFADAGEVLRGSKLPGTLAGVPRWMQAESISISRPEAGGGWLGVDLRAPGIAVADSIYGTGIAAMRVNGVWMLAMPVADATDERSKSAYQGRWMLQCDPLSLEIARRGGAAAISPEPMPPRDLYLLRQLHLAVGLPRETHAAWQTLVRDWRNCVMSLCHLQARRNYCTEVARSSRDRLQHYQRLLDSSFKRHAAQGGRAVDLDEYVSSLRGTARGALLQGWRRSLDQVHRSGTRSESEANELETDIEERRELHDKLLMGLEAFEEEYADAIECLSPDPPSRMHWEGEA